MSNETTVITGRKQIAVAQLLALASALALEINTGMKMSRGRSPLKIAQSTEVTIGDTERPLTTKRTKTGALADVVDVLRQVMPEGWQPGPSVRRALGTEAKPEGQS